MTEYEVIEETEYEEIQDRESDEDEETEYDDDESDEEDEHSLDEARIPACLTADWTPELRRALGLTPDTGSPEAGLPLIEAPKVSGKDGQWMDFDIFAGFAPIPDPDSSLDWTATEGLTHWELAGGAPVEGEHPVGGLAKPGQVTASSGTQTDMNVPRLGQSSVNFAEEVSDEIEWLIPGVLPKAAVVLLSGREGSMKSYLALHMACAVAAGKSWLGKQTKRGAVLYLDGENPVAEISKRVGEFGPDHNLRICSVMRGNYPESLHDSDLQHDSRLYDLIVIDTLRRHMGDLKENNSDDMARITADLKRLKQDRATVLVLHHASGHRPDAPHPRRLRLRRDRDHGHLDGRGDLPQARRGVPGLRPPDARLPALPRAGRALRQRLPRDRAAAGPRPDGRRRRLARLGGGVAARAPDRVAGGRPDQRPVGRRPLHHRRRGGATTATCPRSRA